MSLVSTEGDPITEDAPLPTLFKSPARARIVQAFVEEKGRDLTISDVARLSDTARSTVYRHIDDLEELGVIAHTRDGQDGHSPMYQLNEDSEIAELLYKLEGVTLQKLLEHEEQL